MMSPRLRFDERARLRRDIDIEALEAFLEYPEYEDLQERAWFLSLLQEPPPKSMPSGGEISPQRVAAIQTGPWTFHHGDPERQRRYEAIFKRRGKSTRTRESGS
jgi:hypothetical protein